MASVFISYRRGTSKDLARSIYSELKFRGHAPFLDVESINAGEFNQIILNELAACDNFLLILADGTLDRCVNADDWVLQEIQEALRLDRNIVPVYVENFDTADISRYLPPDVAEKISYHNALPYSYYYHDDFIEKLIDRFLKPSAADSLAKTRTNEAAAATRRLPFLAISAVIAIIVVAIAFVLLNGNGDTNDANMTATTLARAMGQESPMPSLTDTETTAPTVTHTTEPTATVTTAPSPTATTIAISSAECVQTEPLIINEVYVADGFDSPVGDAEARCGTEVWPSDWIDASPFGRRYFVGTSSESVHPGADLNWGSAFADLGQPIYAIASGTVTYAENARIWGDVIVIRHDPVYTPDGDVIYARYAHVQNMQVRVGERVLRGQQIAEVGDADGTLVPHLGIDLSHTDALARNALDWPGNDESRVLANYTDPVLWIQEHRPQFTTTPYDGKNLIWHWKGQSVSENTIAELAANLVANAPNIDGIIVKVADGANWQGSFDSGDMAINGVDDVQRWVEILAEYGLEFHAWAIPNGTDITAETALIAAVAQVDGVQSLILDIEPYQGYWDGGEENVVPFMEALRAGIGDDFHIGMLLDPREHQYDTIFPDEWYPYIDSVHLQIYWTTFNTIPEDAIPEAYDTWGDYGRPLYPIFQVTATLNEQSVGLYAVAERGATGVSWWRYGTTTDYSVINEGLDDKAGTTETSAIATSAATATFTPPRSSVLTETVIYTVQSEDTLGGIAAEYDISLDCLRETNGLDESYTLFAGDVLELSADCPPN